MEYIEAVQYTKACLIAPDARLVDQFLDILWDDYEVLPITGQSVG